MDVGFIGDPFLAPICSTENATLVRLTYAISKYLGVEGAHLRVLASYRLHLAMFCISLILWLFASILK